MAYHRRTVISVSPAPSAVLAEPLSQRDALAIASQLAALLQTQHDRGVILGNLRPARVAYANQRVALVDGDTTPLRSGRVAVYQSPEQIRGRGVDRRADIWAFGCIVFEMLAGAPAFAGETTDGARSAVVERQPDWRRLPPDVPTRILNLLRHCLQKDPKLRLRDVADARPELDEPIAPGGVRENVIVPAWARGISPAIAASVLLVVAAAAAVLGWQLRSADTDPVNRRTGP